MYEKREKVKAAKHEEARWRARSEVQTHSKTFLQLVDSRAAVDAGGQPAVANSPPPAVEASQPVVAGELAI